MSDINKTLAERGSKYGDFTDNARISEGLMDLLRREEGYQNLRPIHRAALNVITQKMARIVNGDPEYLDNWHDMEGYSKLAYDRCEEELDLHEPAIKTKPLGTVDRNYRCINKLSIPNSSLSSSDLAYPSKTKDGWVVEEALYPDSRGYKVHNFDTEHDAWFFYFNPST